MRKKGCKAFTFKCQKGSQVGHFAKFCKKTPDKKTKEEPVKANTVLFMHSTVGTATATSASLGCRAMKLSTRRPSGSR